jgi:hypothetical protein
MGCNHKPVQGQPTDDGVEWEVDVYNIKDSALGAIVLYNPEGDR